MAIERKNLSVRSKIILTVIVSVVALSLAIYAISTQVLLKSYLAIEREGMVNDLRRATDAIEEFENQQLIKLADWASWDQAYNYGLNRDQAWIEENLYATGLANLDVNAIAFADTTGNVFYLQVVDIEERVEVASTSVRDYLVAHPELVAHPDGTTSTKGIVLLPENPLIIVSLPLLMSEGDAPTSGSISFARYIDEHKVEDIAEITHLGVSVYPYNKEMPPDVAAAKTELDNGEEHVIRPVSEGTIVGYTAMQGLDGAPAIIVRVETPRPIYAQGLLTFYVFMGIGAIALLLFGIVILWLLERLVVARFVRLTNDVDKINDVQDLSIRVQGGVKDEIGKLADKINQMISWLSASREEIRMGKERAEDMVRVRTRELFEEKARLLASINSLSFGFVLAGRDDAILLRNPALDRILDLATAATSVADIAAVLGTSFDLLAFCRDSLERKAAAEKAEVQYGRKVLRFLCAPIFPEGENSEAIGYALLIEDITEAKALERSREEFFSIASHELRTPLTAIRGNTQLLVDAFERKLPEAEVKEMLQDIDASSERLIEIVNDFLEVSRLEQGRVELRKEDFDVTDVVGSVVRNLGKLATEKGLSLSYVPGAALPKVRADRVRTEQVLDNLVANAIKFSDMGDIQIDVVAEKGFVKVRVTDHGHGISERNQSLLFRKFQQAGEDILARDVSQSTGLGLYISKLLVTSMGGDIGLEGSEVGKGSTFAFTLPIAPSA